MHLVLKDRDYLEACGSILAPYCPEPEAEHKRWEQFAQVLTEAAD